MKVYIVKRRRDPRGRFWKANGHGYTHDITEAGQFYIDDPCVVRVLQRDPRSPHRTSDIVIVGHADEEIG
jgi:hypothetical protein